MTDYKRVNTKLQVPTYQKLKLLQSKLLTLGIDISLSDTLQGLIHYAEIKGISNIDKRFFEFKYSNDSTTEH